MVLDATEQIEKFQDFLEITYKEQIHCQLSKGFNFLIIDFAELSKFDIDLAEDLLEYPEDAIKAAEMAMEQFEAPKKFKVRFANLPLSQKIPIRNLRSDHLNKFLVIEGIIRQSSEVRPQVVSAKFECPSCGNVITVLQHDNQFREPTKCSCGRKGRFRVLSRELVDVQRLVIEEAPEDLEGGAQPKRLPVFLAEDLVEPKMEKRTTPGSKVRAIGIVKDVPIQLKTGATSVRYELKMDTNFIEPIEEDFSEIEINPEDEKEIKEMAAQPGFYENLVSSIAPSIYGHEKIKEAITLQLMGGVKKQKKDGTITRGDLHILFVGDPGCGKSQLLTFVDVVAPKSRYVAGRSASGAGITATVVKDEFLRGWALEAGALVLADKGILVLDEMDKMRDEDTSALHEGMEQQRISIAKANIQATLRSETSVLAAANPKMGRFDPYTPIPQQINLPLPLINRFDLIFVLRDLPDKVLDSNIASQILANQSYKDTLPAISPEKLRKFIAYVKQKIKPVLTEEAVQKIKEFYVKLRNSGKDSDHIKSIPISPRQLESIIRMSEASARIRLSEKVELQDAERAIALQMYCLQQVGFDHETGQLDIDRIGTGITAATRSKIMMVKNIIFELDAKGKKMIEVEEIIKMAIEKGITEDKVEEAIEKLRRSGDIFLPKPNFIQKI